MVCILSFLWWIRIRDLWKLSDGRDWLAGIWVLLWLVGPCSVNLQSNFLLMGGAVFSPFSLAWGQTIVEVKGTSFQRTYARTVLFSAPNPTEGHCQPTTLLETPGHQRQVRLSFLWGHCSFLLGPSAKILFVASKSLLPQSCESSVIKSHWPSKTNSVGSQTLLSDPQVGKSGVGPRTFATMRELLV